MSGIRTYVQTDMRVAPTEGNHLVRLRDMVEYVLGVTKLSVRVISTSPFAGTYDSTEKTLTQTTPAELIIDGVTLDAGDRVLIAGQVDLTQNGVYVVTTLGVDGTTAAVLTRADDFNESSDLVNGAIYPIDEGDVNAGTRWKLTVGTIPAVLDATNLEFNKQVTELKQVVEMVFDITGDDAETAYPIEHNLGTLNVTHEIYDSVTHETVIAQFTRTSINDVRIDLGVPLGVGNDLVLILRAEIEP